MTLRSRITWILLAVLVPLGVAVGAGLYEFVRISLYARLDDSLAARAESLAAAVKWHDGTLEFDTEDAALPQYQLALGAGGKSIAFYEIWRLKDGALDQLIERSKSLGTQELLDRRRLIRSGRDTVWNADLADDADVRIFGRHVAPAVEGEEGSSVNPVAPAPEVLVAVAVSREAIDRPLEALAIGLLLAGLVLIVSGFVSLRWAITRGLIPVRVLAEQVSAVDAECLGIRLGVDRLPPEIAPIQQCVNSLLDRIGTAMQREKRFTAAAAHELRTPIAELRLLLEVGVSQPRDGEQWRLTAERGLGVLARAQSLCESLLRLSRAEAGQEPSGEFALADVSAVIEELVQRVGDKYGGDGQHVRVDAGRAGTARVDSAVLSSIIGNLLDNAFRYGRVTAEAPIIVRAMRTAGRVRLEVSNAAPSLEPGDLSHLFEPFWRKDTSRHDQHSFGLGLAMARALAQANGGDISAALDGSKTLTVRVELLNHAGQVAQEESR